MLPQTEMTPKPEDCIDAMPVSDALTALLGGQIAAVGAVRSALPAIQAASVLFAQTVNAGGTLNYVAAGSSGLMALADGSELAGTFGIPQSQVAIHMAGGVPVTGAMPGDTEDDISQADDIASGFGPNDLVIALSASGTTPYSCEIARIAHDNGRKVVAIASNAGCPLFRTADVAVLLPTPPEVLAGSTRLGAGTAQKCTLNLISTLAGVHLGHIYKGMMVNLHADNAKLHRRAAGIVSAVSGVSAAEARAALDAADGNAKLAVLISAGCDVGRAKRLIEDHKGHLGPCLKSISAEPQTEF